MIYIKRKEILVNVIQCLQILLEETSASLDLTLVNTVARIKELNPDKETDHLFLWEFRDNIEAIWEAGAVQVRVCTVDVRYYCICMYIYLSGERLKETLLGNVQSTKRVQSSRLLQVRNSFLIKH